MNAPEVKVEERVAPTPTTEEMKLMLQAARAAREQRALQRIQQVLQEEGCNMAPVMILSEGIVTGRIEVKALD